MKSKKTMRILSVILAVVMVAALLAACTKPTGTASTQNTSNVNTNANNTDVNGQGGSTAASGDPIKIGFVWPMTGGSASIGESHNDGATWAIEEINAAGGVKSIGNRPIEIVLADSETTPDVGANQVERLIVEEKVPIVVGCYNSSVTFPAAKMADSYETPFISMGGVADPITTSGFKWVFRVNNMATFDVQEMVRGLRLMEEEAKVKVENYALIYESTDWGTDNARIWKETAKEDGWKCLVDEPVVNGQADMTAQAMKIKSSNAQVINYSFYVDDALVFHNALWANKVNPIYGIWSVGGGTQDKNFFKNCPAQQYEYVFVQEDWDVSGPINHKWIADVGTKVKEKLGYTLTSYFAQGWTAAYVAYEALEAAGSVDKPAIQAALQKLDIENSDDCRIIMTGYPRIKFNENGQNTYSTGTIIQYQKGKQVALSPVANRTPGGKFICPIPDDMATRFNG